MKKIISIFLSVVIFLLSVFTGYATDVATEEEFLTGYDRGYTGSMAGDGKIYAHGVDLSSYQEGINFENIKNDGFDFVILRCGTSKGKDSKFEENYNTAKEVGLDVGVYYYSYATTVKDASVDAENTLKYIADKTFEYPIYFDFEDKTQDKLSVKRKSDICYKFMDTLKDKGYLVGIYSMKSRLVEDWVTTSGLRSTYEGWIAHYWDYDYKEKSKEYKASYGMYQYTDRKKITGWKYGVDADVTYKNYPLIVKAYGFNGYEADLSLLKTNITLTKSKAILYLKGKTQIEANVMYGVGKPVYKSSNTKVATVSSSGIVTAKKAGTANITVTNNGVTKTFKVTVKNPTLNRKNLTLKLKKKYTLKIKGQVGKAKFTSSNRKKVYINPSGKMVAKKKGKVTITVKTNGITLKCKVTVK